MWNCFKCLDGLDSECWSHRWWCWLCWWKLWLGQAEQATVAFPPGHNTVWCSFLFSPSSKNPWDKCPMHEDGTTEKNSEIRPPFARCQVIIDNSSFCDFSFDSWQMCSPALQPAHSWPSRNFFCQRKCSSRVDYILFPCQHSFLDMQSSLMLMFLAQDNYKRHIWSNVAFSRKKYFSRK